MRQVLSYTHFIKVDSVRSGNFSNVIELTHCGARIVSKLSHLRPGALKHLDAHSRMHGS